MLLSSDATTYQNVEEEIDYDVLTVALNVHFYGDDSAGSALYSFPAIPFLFVACSS